MEFRILGPLEVVTASGPMPVGGARSRAVLATLVVRANYVVPAETIADQIWPGLDAGRAAANLQVRLSELRKAFRAAGEDGRLLTRAPGYLLRAAEDEIDALRFAGLTARGRALLAGGDPAGACEALAAALALWRGPVLADIGDPPWAQAEADRLGEARLTALELHADARLGRGADDELAGELQHLTAAYPLRERFWAQRILALYRVGRQAEALSVYGQARSYLVGELGIEPGSELRDLQARVLAHDPALAAAPPERAEHDRAGTAGRAVPRQLPAAVRQFTARETELKVLEELAGQAGGPGGTVAISAISGPAGVGKTALALQWAHRVAGQFPDGQLYVNLRGFDPAREPLSAAEAIRGFLDGFAVPADQVPADPEAMAGLYRGLAADRRLLIVLDNARDAAHVRPLLPAGAGCLVLVTSRSGLQGLVAGEGALPLPVGMLPDDDAVRLLASRLGPERLAGDPAAARRLTALCAGLPLALAIAAARATAQPEVSLAALVDQLAAEPDRLDAFETGDDATSIRSVLSWSGRHLSAQAARLFRLLGVHPGPDVSAAAAASLAGVTLREARRALAELAAASLASEQPPGRYVLHDLVRAYAAEQAREADTDAERTAAIRRTLDHYLHTAARAVVLSSAAQLWFELDPPLPGVTIEPLAGADEALAWLQAERQVLVAMTYLAAQAGLDGPAWQIPQTLRTYLFRAGHWQDWAAVSLLGLEAARRLGDHTALGYALLAMANVRIRSGDQEAGITLAADGLGQFLAIGDRGGEAGARAVLAAALMRAGRHRAALEHAEQALALYRGMDAGDSEAYALATVGELHALLGDARAGIGYCQQAVERGRARGDPGVIAATLSALGRAQLRAGDLPESAASFAGAAENWPADRSYGRAESYFGLGDALDAAGDHRAACQAWQRGLDVLGHLHHPDADRVRARTGQPVR